MVSDHQPLKNVANLSTKVNRVQCWFDCLSAYTYTLQYRPGKSNGNSDLLSRLPLPATEADNHPDVRLPDPEDIDMYLTVRVDYNLVFRNHCLRAPVELKSLPPS